MEMSRAIWGAFCLLALGGTAAAQQVNLEGYFIALTACEANKRRDSDNPGNVRLEVMRAYRMIGRNTTPGTHYQIRVPGAPETEARWVAMRCGDFAPRESLVIAGGTPSGEGDPTPGSGAPAPDSVENQLVASWQPGFCSTNAGQNKDECRTQTADRPDATQFSIHGMWPDDLDNKDIFPCYCNLSSPIACNEDSEDDDSIDLSPGVLAKLEVAMPGVQSDLHLHEWTKHGTCYEDFLSGGDAGSSPDEYYGETMALLDQLNASGVRNLFVEHLGQDLTAAEIEAAFDAAFGAGAGKRMVVRCDRNSGVITEMWIGLKGDISATSNLGALILAAPPTFTSTNARSCSGPVVKVN
jgi:ribonuclease T2